MRDVVGPDLTATQFADPASLLTHVLDPNRYVAPNHVQYIVSDRSGRVYTGLVASETAASLTLRRARGGGGHAPPQPGRRADQHPGKSLIPEDFASSADPDGGGRPRRPSCSKSRSGPAPRARGPPERLDVGTLPGLVESEGRAK